MTQICSACGRGALSANLRSKSMVAVKTRQKVNVQSRRIDGKRVRVCTRCIKTMVKKPGTVNVSNKTKRAVKRRTKRSA